MSEQKLMELLKQLYNQEIYAAEAFDEIACHIDFEEPYEGE
jgi:hypothetical protein